MKTPKTTHLLIFLASVLAILGTGCSFIDVDNQSLEKMSYRDLFGDDPSESSLDRVAIYAVAKNESSFGLWGIIIPPIIPYWDFENYKEGFWIVITVRSQPWHLSFDPRQLVLETEEGERIPAKGYVGPQESTYFNFKDSHEVGNLNTTEGLFPIKKELSVGVLFPVETLSPGQHFSLILKGFYRSGQLIAAPRMRFLKRSYRHVSYTIFQLNPHGGPNFSKDWTVNE